MKKVLFSIFLFLLFEKYAIGQLTVNTTMTPQQLVQNVLLGQGVVVSNITFTGDSRQIAGFTNVGTNALGFASGVMLTTGDATGYAVATNTQGGFTSGTMSPSISDPSLNALSTPNFTEDAAVLEFDFVPTSDTIKFKYAFASEEYNEFTCSNFNDVFGFFLSGPGFPTPTNIALIPNTTLAVAINNVNNGLVGGSGGNLANCTLPAGSLAYSQYFVDNTNGVSIEFDGFTTTLTARAVVQACQTYHIKLAIGDVFDFQFDSGVFFEANSFDGGNVQLEVSSFQNQNITYEGCYPMNVTLHLNQPSPTPYNIPITVSGTAQNGVDFVTLPPFFTVPAGQDSITFTIQPILDNLPEGTENMRVVFQSSLCEIDTLDVLIKDSLIVSNTIPLDICQGTLNTLNLSAGTLDSPNPVGSFAWSPSAGLNSTTIQTPVANVSQPIDYTCTYTLDAAGTCRQYTHYDLSPSPYSINISPMADQSLCGGTSSAQLNAGLGALPPFVFTDNLPPTPIVIPVAPATSHINDYPFTVSGVLPTTVVAGLISTVCVNITQPFNSHISIFLIAPSGQQIELSSGNGGFGANGYANCCFTTNPAATPISNYPVTIIPPNGTYKPEGNWNSLLGATVNGTWIIRVVHSVNSGGGGTAGTFNGVTFTLNNLNSANLLWSPPAGLSATNIANPVATPTQTTTYQVVANNLYGCKDTATVTVFVQNGLPTPVVTCGTSSFTGVVFNWAAIPGASFYTVSINGGAPQNVGTVTTYTQSGTTGQSFTISVIANPPAGSLCGPSAAGTQTCTVSSCASLSVSIGGTLTVCGSNTTILTADPGFATYHWNNNAATQSINVGIGTWSVTVTDINGCSASSSVTITQNPSLNIGLTPANPVACAGSSVTLTASGADTYTWSTPTGAATGNSIAATTAGTYSVTGTQAGCTGTASTSVTFSTGVTASNVQTVCATNGLTYTVSFSLSGGTGGYTVNGNPIVGNTYFSIPFPSGVAYSFVVASGSACPAIVVTGTNSCVVPIPCNTPVGCFGPNLIPEGNFETFNSGSPFFTTDYAYSNCPLATSSCNNAQGVPIICQYHYAVETSPNPCNPDFSNNIHDHTSGTGNMMVVDFPSGNVAPNNEVWCKAVNLAPATDYCFGAWFINLLPTGTNLPLPLFSYSVNNSSLGQTPPLPENEQWVYYGYQFNSGAGGLTNVCILNQNFGSMGYDLAIDDIILREVGNGTPPIVSNDQITTCSGVAGTVNVLTNDAPGVLPATLTILSAPPFSDGTVSANTTTGVITFTPATGFNGTTDFEYQVCDGLLCCSSATVSVTVNANLSPTITPNGATSFCFGGSVVLDGGAGYSTYSWSPGGEISQTVAVTQTGTYSLTVTDANGCSGTAAQNVTAFPLPTANAGPDLFTQPNVGVNLQGSGTGGTTPYSFTWDNGLNPVANPLATVPVTTVFNLTLTDANGCTATDDMTLFVCTPPIVDAGLDQAICLNQSASLSVSATGGAGSYTFQWNSGQSTQAISVSPTVTTDYIITVTDGGGCFAFDTVNVVVNSLPTPTVVTTNGATSFCFNNDLILNAGAGYSAYTWFNNSGSQQITVGQSGTYSVTVTDANGCQGSDDITVTEFAPLLITGITDSVSCAGYNDGSINITPTGGNGTYSIYAWSNSAVTQDITGLIAGTYSVTVFDSFGCVGNATFQIGEPASAVGVLADPEDASCYGVANGIAIANPFGGTGPYTFNWSSGAATQTANGLATGNYIVTVTDSRGCQDTARIFIDQPAELVVNTVSIVPTTCYNTATGIATIIASGGTPSYAYQWSNGATTPTANNLPAGTATVIVSDANGCLEVENIVIPEPAPVVPIIGTVTPPDCSGTNTGHATVSGSGGTPPYSYLWDAGAGGQQLGTATGLASGSYTITVTDFHGCTGTKVVVVPTGTDLEIEIHQTAQVICNGDATAALQVTATGGVPAYTYLWSNGDTNALADSLTAGNYTVVVTDSHGCTVTASEDITEPAPLNAVLTTEPLTCYDSGDGQIAVAATGGRVPYTHNIDGGIFQSGSNFPGLESGMHHIITHDFNGCEYLDSIEVIAPDTFTAVITPIDTTLEFGDTYGIEVTVNPQGNITYIWTPHATLSCIDCPDPTVNVTTSNVYTVLVRDENGCEITLQSALSATFPRRVYVANLFSPNNDGKNDVFLVQGGRGVKQVKVFRVYDRWGEMVHEALDIAPNDLAGGWNGTFRGKDMSGAVFTWYAEVLYDDGKTEFIKGDVTLVR